MSQRNTVPGPLDGGRFDGKTKSFTVIHGGAKRSTCKVCGSTLYPSRRESRNVRTIGGELVHVDKYRCGCHAGYEVRRQAA